MEPTTELVEHCYGTHQPQPPEVKIVHIDRVVEKHLQPEPDHWFFFWAGVGCAVGVAMLAAVIVTTWPSDESKAPLGSSDRYECDTVAENYAAVSNLEPWDVDSVWENETCMVSVSEGEGKRLLTESDARAYVRLVVRKGSK